MAASASSKAISEIPVSPQLTTLSGNTLHDDGFDAEAQEKEKDIFQAQARQPFIVRLWHRLRQQRSADDTLSEQDSDDGPEQYIRTIEDQPDGYPRLACFLSSDQNFGIYRGFSYLHSRLLLNIQDEVRAFEKKLDDLDEIDGYNARGVRSRLNSRVKDVEIASQEGPDSRQALLGRIKTKLLEYGSFSGSSDSD
ncbi:MAG: hypothetical protein Q9162_004661 [Coniocarpon cinnabarinum]